MRGARRRLRRRDAPTYDPGVSAEWTAENWWRLGRDRYDLIVQILPGSSPDEVVDRLSWEWMEGLRTRLTHRGALVVALPPGGWRDAALPALARTLRDSFAASTRAAIRCSEHGFEGFLVAAPAGVVAYDRLIGGDLILCSLDDLQGIEQARLNTLRAPTPHARPATNAPGPLPAPPSIARGSLGGHP